MLVSIQEKVDQLTTNLMEVAGIPDTVAGLYNKLPKDFRNTFFRDFEGLSSTPGALKNIAFRGLLDLGDRAGRRGAGEGAAMGAVGGGLLGMGVASAGIPQMFTTPTRSAKKSYTKSRVGGKGVKGAIGRAMGQGLASAVGSAVKTGAMGAAGGVAGSLGGGLAGFRGGKEAGAAILGAGTVGGPAALALGPFAGAAAAFGGAGIGSDIAQSYMRSRRGLQTGGDPYNLVFKQ